MKYYKIKKGGPVKKTRISADSNGYSYEYTTSRPLTDLMAKKRLMELYGGICVSCGAWPSCKVKHNVGDKHQGAHLLETYCSACFEKRKDKITK